MSLHAELAGATAPACKVCAFLSNFAPSEVAEWQVELALPINLVSNTAVVNALRRRGESITEASVRRHRSNHV